MPFGYQEMDVYHIAMGFVDSVHTLLALFPSPRPSLLERLESVSVDIPLTLARVSGRTGTAMLASDLREVRSVVYECQALIEILWRRKLLSDKESDDLNGPLMVMANLLSR
ncbi:four helix bundle protein [bacterium]|nr:four helix bundle protein [candidate division CSSED10-310 bacterium]